MASKHTYLVGARRSPVGRFLGGLSRLSAAQIGTQVAAAVVKQTGIDPAQIDEVMVGMVLQGGAGQNPARQVALGAGCPQSVSACTINKVCGSGLQSVMYADQVIRAGDADIILAGGIESMSQAPFISRDMRGGRKFGDVQMLDSLQFDGLVNIYDGDLMGNIAEETAEKHSVTREEQDEVAALSHQRAAKAVADGHVAEQIVPIEPRPGKPPIDSDEGIRPETTADALALLKPAFKQGGTVTAANASQLSDGAGMVFVVNDAGLKKLKMDPMVRVVGHVTSGLDPREVFLTPIPATKLLCDKTGWSRDDVDLWEINEAFAAEIIAVRKALELDIEKLNVHGGAIAIGHPLGASGTRCLVTGLHAMKQRAAKKGVVSLCLGGGNAVAMAVESL